MNGQNKYKPLTLTSGEFFEYFQIVWSDEAFEAARQAAEQLPQDGPQYCVLRILREGEEYQTISYNLGERIEELHVVSQGHSVVEITIDQPWFGYDPLYQKMADLGYDPR